MIRPSLPGDLPYLTRLIKIAAERGEILPRSDAYLRRHVGDEEFFTAVLNSHPGGCASLHLYSYRLAEIIAFTVTQPFRKNGQDTLLIKACQEKARRKKVEMVMIIAGAGEAAFLKKLGFGPATKKERFGLFWQPGALVGAVDPHFIRRAVSTDLPAIAGLIDTAARREELLPRSDAEIARGLDHFFVALESYDGPQIVGCCGLDIHPLEKPELAEIRSLTVNPAHAYQGFGRQLVRACQMEAARLNVPEVLAVTHEVNFFKDLGFRRSARVGLAFFWHPT